MKSKLLSRLGLASLTTFSAGAFIGPHAFASTTTYYAYQSAYTNHIKGVYSSLSAAEDAIKNIPGGVVKNSSWHVVYIQPSFYSFLNAYANTILNTYPNLLDAEVSLMNTPGGVVKNSSWQFEFIEPTVAYYTYDSATSNTITGVYTSLSDAESAISSKPGAVVKNSQWQFLYQQPSFYTYDSVYSNGITGIYPSLQAAEQAISNKPGAAIKNSNWQFVYVAPAFYTYDSVNSNNITGVYSTLQSAESAVSNIPGAAVKDSRWQFVYVVPTFYTYDSVDSNSITGVYTTLQAAENAVANVPGGVVKNSSWQFVYIRQGYDTIDLRYAAPNSVTASSINSWINTVKSGQSPLYGLGASYIDAQNTYGVDAAYLLAHSIEETGWGTSGFATSRNNLFGYGAYTNSPSDAGVFPSDDYAIRFQAWVVHQNYLTPGGSEYWNSPTLYGMNHNYATDTSWSSNISSIMQQYVQQTGGNFSDYKQYSSNNTPSAPSSTTEPVYYLNGATGTIQSNSVYSSGIPVYSDIYTGGDTMLSSELSVSMSGTYDADVAKLQAFLNTPDGGDQGVGVDGYYGPQTAGAVANYQSKQGISSPMVNGYAACDLTTWENAFSKHYSETLAANTQVSVEQIKQGMFDGIVTEWYYVKDSSNGISGWVNSDYVNFDNVYRIFPTSDYNITIDGVQLHNGDYVVSNDGSTLQFCDNSGNPKSGPKGTATLSKIIH